MTLRTVIHATTVELDVATRRSLDSQLIRDLGRYEKEIEVATAYVSIDKDGSPYVRVAVQAVGGKRHSTETKAETYLQALSQAASQMAAALQRESARKSDPRLNRPKTVR